MTKRINIYALRQDLLDTLRQAESLVALKYVLMDSSQKPKQQVWYRAEDIPGLGECNGSQSNLCHSYLMTLKDLPIQARKIEQIDGTHRFAIDQLINPNSIIFIPGGKLNATIILAGTFGTASDSKISQGLMKQVSASVRKRFTKIHAYWVGPDALRQFRDGKRLTISEHSPAIYDLRVQE